MEPPHRIGIILRPRPVIKLLALGIEKRHRGDELLFAIRLRANLLRLVNVFLAALDFCRIRLVPKLVPDHDRLAPARHRAMFVFLRNVVKSLAGLLVLERMHQSDRALE